MGVDWHFLARSERTDDQMWEWSIGLKDSVVRGPNEFVYAGEALVQFWTGSGSPSTPTTPKHYGFVPTHRWAINGVHQRSSSAGGDAGFLFALEFMRDHPGDCVYDRDGFGLIRRWHGRVMASASDFGPGSRGEHLIRPPYVTVPVELDDVPWANLQRFDWPPEAGHVPPKPPDE